MHSRCRGKAVPKAGVDLQALPLSLHSRFFNPSLSQASRDTVEYASRGRDKSKPGIKTLLPFRKSNTEESAFENFQDLIVALDACYWLHKAKSISLSRFGDDRKCDSSRFLAAISCFLEDFMYCFVSLVLCLHVCFYLRVKEILR